MNDHERGFLVFLAEPTKRRMATLLNIGEKRRRDVRAMLDHAVRLDSRLCRHLTGTDSLRDPAEALLRAHGAPATCYVLAARPELDGREMPLAAALNAVIGMGSGAFLSCIPGRLGFYEYEGPSQSYLLLK